MAAVHAASLRLPLLTLLPSVVGIMFMMTCWWCPDGGGVCGDPTVIACGEGVDDGLPRAAKMAL